MKILIFECWNQSPQFETGLEIAEVHAGKGDDVYYVNIGQELPFLEWHPDTRGFLTGRLLKQYYSRKINKAKQVLNSRVIVSTDDLLKKEEKTILRSKLLFRSVEDLKSYKWEGIDVGMATASSLISITNDLDPSTSRYKKTINSIIYSSRVVAKSFEKWLELTSPDLIYFRNGRVAVYRPILRICQRKKLNFIVHDRGCDKFHYSLNTNYRHDNRMITQQIQNAWENATDPQKERIAATFYQERRDGIEQSWKVFTTEQKSGTLPHNWNKDKFNIVFFTSSISEYVAIGEEMNPNRLFPSQIAAVKEIAGVVKSDKDINFYIRLHPNLLRQSKKEQQLWRDLSLKNVEIINADAEVDTYTLIDHASLIVVYISTVGAEASYWGKPSVIAGRAAYEELNAAYFPMTKEELFEYILNKNLPAKPKIGALKFGYYMKTFGERHIYYVPKDFHSGTFKGVDLQKLPFLLHLQKMPGTARRALGKLRRTIFKNNK